MIAVWREVSPPLLGERVLSPLAQSASVAGEALIPIGLLLGFLRLRLERASIGALAADLTLGAAVREQLQGVLARRLGDPKLQVGFWSQDGATYVDRDGQALEIDRLSADRTVSMLDRDGRPSVAIVFDAALAEDPGLLEHVGAVVRLAVCWQHNGEPAIGAGHVPQYRHREVNRASWSTGNAIWVNTVGAPPTPASSGWTPERLRCRQSR